MRRRLDRTPVDFSLHRRGGRGLLFWDNSFANLFAELLRHFLDGRHDLFGHGDLGRWVLLDGLGSTRTQSRDAGKMLPNLFRHFLELYAAQKLLSPLAGSQEQSSHIHGW